LMRELGLWEGRDLFPHNFSRGMRLKLGLAMAFIRPFRVLLLDEPTSALDPEGVELVRQKLVALRDQGVAVLLSSHDQVLAQQLSDRVWRLQQGNLEMG
jgi:ABC-type multidrug transport system ATPase subunit